MPNVSLLLFSVVAAALMQTSSARSEVTETTIEPLPTENTVPTFMYERHLLGWKIEYLHRVNIGDVDGLRSELQDWMVWDGFAIWQFLQKGQLTPKEQEQAYGQLRLMAIQYEKYPVAKWKDNAELQSIFKAALEENPERAATIRAKNWKRPMWLP
ncbi:MAG: hypothetical protein E6H67_16805 [Betaproteobacteria bacterium]|nr:MAG: hypothetical protein E6H67_16805 [Betaproteobacteria bacterium]